MNSINKILNWKLTADRNTQNTERQKTNFQKWLSIPTDTINLSGKIQIQKSYHYGGQAVNKWCSS